MLPRCIIHYKSHTGRPFWMTVNSDILLNIRPFIFVVILALNIAQMALSSISFEIRCSDDRCYIPSVILCLCFNSKDGYSSIRSAQPYPNIPTSGILFKQLAKENVNPYCETPCSEKPYWIFRGSPVSQLIPYSSPTRLHCRHNYIS